MPLERVLTPEIMDDPRLDAPSHHAALDGLDRINRLSRSARTLESGVRRVLGDKYNASVLDVATGSGELAIDLAARASRNSLSLRVSACDVSDRALERARAGSAARDAGVDFFQIDAIRGDPLPETDVVTCSLFLHHLDRDEAVVLLQRMRDAARVGVVVNDLRRARRGVALARLASRALTRSPVVHTDAVLSARAAWTIDELRALMDDAGMTGAKIERRWPMRMLATWRRDDG